MAPVVTKKPAQVERRRRSSAAGGARVASRAGAAGGEDRCADQAGEDRAGQQQDVAAGAGRAGPGGDVGPSRGTGTDLEQVEQLDVEENYRADEQRGPDESLEQYATAAAYRRRGALERRLRPAQAIPARSATRSRCCEEVAEQLAAGPGPLEQEVEIVLPGEADSTVNLDRRLGHRPGGVAGRGPSPSPPRPAATQARHRRPTLRSRSASAPPRRRRASPRRRARPPGRRRSADRTARAPWRTGRPCPSPAARRRSVRPRRRR